MADDVKDTKEQAQPDPINNLKSEFNRKLTNLEESNQKLAETLQALIQRVTPEAAPKQSQSKPLSEMVYDDPEGFVNTVVTKAVEGSRKVMDTERQADQKRQAVFMQLFNDYPELVDSSNELTKKTLEIYSAMSAEEKASPLGMKMAARDAATEMGVVPKSKRRNQDSDDFSFGGSSGGTGGERKSKGDKQEDEAILSVASLFKDAFKDMGKDVNDPKFQKRLLDRKKRAYNRYE